MYSLQQMMSKKFETVVKTEQQLLQKSSVDRPFLIKRDKEVNKIFEKKGEWTLKENAKYIVFLQGNASEMSGKSHSQLWQVYKKMADFVKTRNYRQCKSHHQKQCNKFQAISDIIENIIKAQPSIEKEIERQRQNYEIIIQKENQVKIRSEGITKKDEMSQKPTDIFYEQQQNVPDNRKSVNNFQHMVPVFFNGNAPQLMMQSMRKPTPQDWLQCHSLFLQYVSKMNELKMREFV